MGSLIYKPVLKLKLTKLNPHSKHKTSIKGKLCTVITSLKQAGYNINRCDVKLSLWGGLYTEGTLYVHKNLQRIWVKYWKLITWYRWWKQLCKCECYLDEWVRRIQSGFEVHHSNGTECTEPYHRFTATL